MIYFVAETCYTNLVKIGFTRKEFDIRWRGLVTMSPVPLEVIKVVPVPIDEERRLHKIFAKYRKHGEWFEFNHTIKEFIDSYDGAPEIYKSVKVYKSPYCNPIYINKLYNVVFESRALTSKYKRLVPNNALNRKHYISKWNYYYYIAFIIVDREPIYICMLPDKAACVERIEIVKSMVGLPS